MSAFGGKADIGWDFQARPSTSTDLLIRLHRAAVIDNIVRVLAELSFQLI
jgi:hypothetical protein